MKKGVFIFLCLVLVSMGGLIWRWYLIVPLQERFDPVLQNFAFVIPTLKPMQVIGVPRAVTCGGCHQEIYKEWSQTTHAHALEDLQFQAELAKPDNPAWLCLNCHIPIQNQREFRVTGLIEGDLFKPVTQVNSSFDKKMQAEAITCAVCHVRPDPDTGESYIIGNIGSPLAPHPVKKDREFLRTICLRCHDPQGERLAPNLFCWFQTRKELEDGQENLERVLGEKKDCVDCHMPEVQRRIAAFDSLPLRNAHQHHWTGGGIPKRFEHYKDLLNRGFEPGLRLEVADPEKQTSGNWELTVVFSNRKAGHKVPTGDPERHYLTHVKLLSAKGELISSSSYRIGQTWEWSPARKLGDNRLMQGESRTWKFHLKVAIDNVPARIQVHTWHVKLSSKTALYIQKISGIRSDLNPRAAEQIKDLPSHYPFATLIYSEEIQLDSLKRTHLTSRQLMKISAMEAGNLLSEREY
jgi:hypothetical protein